MARPQRPRIWIVHWSGTLAVLGGRPPATVDERGFSGADRGECGGEGLGGLLCSLLSHVVRG